MNLFAPSTLDSVRSTVTTPPSTFARRRYASMACPWRARMGARGSFTQRSAAISASGRRCIASMIRAGTDGSLVASSSVMTRSAGSSRRTAVAGESKRAASMTSAQRTSSSSSGARHSNRAASVRAMNPVQLGAAGSQNFWPERSPSNAARSAGVGNALAW